MLLAIITDEKKKKNSHKDKIVSILLKPAFDGLNTMPLKLSRNMFLKKDAILSFPNDVKHYFIFS